MENHKYGSLQTPIPKVDTLSAVQSILVFERAFSSGDLVKAERMLYKAKRFDPSLNIEEELSLINEAKIHQGIEEKQKEVIEHTKNTKSDKDNDSADQTETKAIITERKDNKAADENINNNNAVPEATIAVNSGTIEIDAVDSTEIERNFNKLENKDNAELEETIVKSDAGTKETNDVYSTDIEPKEIIAESDTNNAEPEDTTVESDAGTIKTDAVDFTEIDNNSTEFELINRDIAEPKETIVDADPVTIVTSAGASSEFERDLNKLINVGNARPEDTIVENDTGTIVTDAVKSKEIESNLSKLKINNHDTAGSEETIVAADAGTIVNNAGDFSEIGRDLNNIQKEDNAGPDATINQNDAETILTDAVDVAEIERKLNGLETFKKDVENVTIMKNVGPNMKETVIPIPRDDNIEKSKVRPRDPCPCSIL